MADLLARFIRFAGVGGAATALQYVLMLVTVEFFGVVPLYSSVGAYLVSAGFNYWANYHYTFSATVRHSRALPRFALVSGAGLLINAFVFYVVYQWVGLFYMLAQIIASGFVLMWNFLANHFWSFADGSNRGRVSG